MDPQALPKNPRILIVLLGSLGDVARGLALVDALKQARPAAHITWLVEPKCQDLVRLHPRVDNVLLFERARGLSALVELRKKLRAQTFDICLDLQRHFKSGLFSWLSAAPVRVGFHPSDSKEGNHYFNTTFVPALGEDVPKLLHYLHFAEALGGCSAREIFGGKASFGYSEHAAEELLSAELRQKLQNAKPLLGVGLGSTWRTKDWPLEGYRELLKLISGDFTPVLLGDRSQLEMAQALGFENQNAIDLTSKINLRELLGVLKLLRAYIGPDSGPVHIASACGVPCVTLFGPTCPERVAPYNNSAGVMQANLGCIACYRKVCPGLGTMCMRLLDPRKVAERIRQVSAA